MTPLLFALEPELPLCAPLRRRLDAETGQLAHRRFPDGESYLRIQSQVSNRHCVILANLAQPDDKFLPLTFLCTTLRELGANSVGLVAPYLCYMRQDCRFAEGEAVTSRIFAGLLSAQVDWLVTADPHLHRYRSLDEIYRIPATAVPAAPLLANWLAHLGGKLLLVGPDAESEQWVGEIASRTGQPFAVGEKQRRGDREVTVVLPDLSAYRGRRVVVIDDVIASGHTLFETISVLQAAGFSHIDCAAVHALFVNGADRKLRERGIDQLVTSNSIPHPSNALDLSEPLAAAIRERLAAVEQGDTKA